MKPMNFIPRHRLDAIECRRCAAQWKRRCMTYAIIVLVATAGMQLSPATSEGDEITAGIVESRSTIAEHRERIADLQHGLDTIEQELAASQSIGRQPDWSVMLAMLAAPVDENLVITKCKLTSTQRPRAGTDGAGTDVRFIVTIEGYGRTNDDVSAFLMAIEAPAVFDSLTLSRSRREPFLSNQAVSFEIAGVIDPPLEAAQ